MNDLDKKQWVMRLESSLVNFGEAIRIVAFHNPLDPEGGHYRVMAFFMCFGDIHSLSQDRAYEEVKDFDSDDKNQWLAQYGKDLSVGIHNYREEMRNANKESLKAAGASAEIIAELDK